MGWLILGVILLIGAAILYAISRSSKRESLALTITDLMPIGDLMTLHEKVAGEVGKGSFAQHVAVQGTIVCDQPLQADLSNTACAAFRQRVERRYEEDYQEQDGNGHWVTRTRTQSETAANNERHTAFAIQDATGRIGVVPDGAEMEMETTIDRFDPITTGNQGGVLQLGSFHIDLSGLSGTGEARTLGYHFHEEVLPLGRPVYVIGAASDASGTLLIGKSRERHKPFRVSLRTRDQLMQSAKQRMTYTLYGAIGCGALGALFTLIGILTRR